MGARIVDEETIDRKIANAIAGGLQFTTVELNDAQIKALPSLAIEVLAAPGSGKIINVINVVLILNAVSGAYTNYAGGIFFKLLYGNEDATTGIEITAAMVENAVISYAMLASYSSITGSISAVEDSNVKISLADNGSDLEDGNAANTLKVTVYFTVVNL